METSLAALPALPPASAARRRAILCVLGEGFCFAVAAALIKATRASGIPVTEMVVFRSLVIVLAMAALLLRSGTGLLALLRTRHPLGHVVRTLLGFFGMMTSYLGYLRLPLATVTSLNFAMPLFLTVLSVPLLGERVGWRRASAVTAGFLGVLLIVRPWRDASAAMPFGVVGLVLAGVFTWALSTITIRRLGAAGERAATIVLWYSLGSLAIALVLALPVWVRPSPRDAGLLVAAGLVTAAAQWLMTEGYRGGEATAVAPFEYGAIVHATILGALLWGELPDRWSFAGIAVLVAAGLYIWRRETRMSGA